jgi:hypothetical protein
VKQILAMVLLTALSTVAHAQVTCQTSGNTTTCNGSLGGSTISDSGAFNSNLAKISAAQYGPNAVALQQQAAAQARLANQQARLVAQQAEYVRVQTEALERQQQAEESQRQQQAEALQKRQDALELQSQTAQRELAAAAAARAGISNERYAAAQARCRAVSGGHDSDCNELDANDVIRSEAVAARQH